VVAVCRVFYRVDSSHIGRLGLVKPEAANSAIVHTHWCVQPSQRVVTFPCYGHDVQLVLTVVSVVVRVR